MAYYKPEELENIRKGLQWAKKNPSDPKSIEIQNRLKNGQLNFELKALGLKEVPVQVPKIVIPKMPEAGQMSKIPEKGFTTKVIEDIPSDFSEMGETLRSGLEKTGQNILDKATKEDRSLAEKATMVGGETLKGIGRFVGNSLIGLGKLALPQSLEDSISEGVEKFGGKIAEESLKFIERVKESDHPIDQAVVAKLNEMVNRYKTDERFRDQVDAGAGFAQGLLELYGTGKAVSATKEVAETIVDTSTAAYRATAPVVTDVAQQTFESAKDVGTKVIKKADELSIVNNANRVAKQEAKVDDAVARIIQGTPEDIAKAKKALFELTPEQRSSTMDYKELREVADSNIEALSKKQDAELAQYTEKYTNDTLGKYTKVGNKTVVENPVQDALDGLENAYKMSGEAVNAERIAQLRNKLDTEGLTVQEINKIAKEYGTEYKSRSFDKAGNPKQGFNAESFENVRKGVKDVLRERLPGDVSKTLDESISAQYALRDLAGTMEERAFKAYSKLRQKTLKEKVGEIGGVAFEAIDLLSLGTFRGFLSKMNLKVGKKFNDVIELEKELSKNLVQIDKLLAIKDEKKFTEAMAKYLEEVQPGLSTRVTSGLSNAEKDALLGKLNNIKSTDVTSDVPSGAASGGYKPELDIELSGRLDELKAKSEKAGGLTEREYAELKVLMDEVELNTNQTIAPSFSKGEIPTTKGVSSLEAEARKYKSAEEFVKAKLSDKPVTTNPNNYGETKTYKVLEDSWNSKEDSVTMPRGSIVFRGGKEGVYHSADLGTAESYALDNAPISAVDISGKKLANFQTFTGGKYASDPNVDLVAVLKKALNEGYDGLYSRDNYGEVILPTKSQLTDIWKKANGQK